jgi:phospholipid/cholesterol/gamma-HCH transport system ATP-binding protein
MTVPLIEFQNVNKSFDHSPVLDGVNLRIFEGEVTSLIGKSGVGKSVALKHIIGLMIPDQGDILFYGKRLREMKRKEKKALKEQISFMFQNNALFDSLTVFQNVALPLTERRDWDKEDIDEQVNSKIEALELGEFSHKYPSQLSGGMQKRTALARALVTDPKIVLFDEPTTGLDPIRKDSVLSMIARYQHQFGFSALLVSHDIPDIFYISNRIAIIDQGKIIFEGPPLELEQCQHQTVLDFFNSLESLKNQSIGLLTRRNLEQRYLQKIEDFQGEHTLSLLLLVVDDLERIKERTGHLTAEYIVGRVTAIARKQFDKESFAGRYSQDRVVIFIQDIQGDELESRFEQFTEKIKNESLLPDALAANRCVNISIHAGMCTGPCGKNIHFLVDKAERDRRILLNIQCSSEN